jgi:hypothetical protein
MFKLLDAQRKIGESVEDWNERTADFFATGTDAKPSKPLRSDFSEHLRHTPPVNDCTYCPQQVQS